MTIETIRVAAARVQEAEQKLKAAENILDDQLKQYAEKTLVDYQVGDTVIARAYISRAGEMRDAKYVITGKAAWLDDDGEIDLRYHAHRILASGKTSRDASACFEPRKIIRKAA